jgi:hypothetical protein
MMRRARNLLIALGAYYASTWMAALVSWLLTLATGGVQTTDYALRSGIRSLVNGAPDAAASAFCGIAIALVADSPIPARWTAVPAVLFVIASIERAQSFATTWSDLTTQALIGSLPAVICVAAGQMAARHRL